jgi:uncharacterized protein DUF6152
MIMPPGNQKRFLSVLSSWFFARCRMKSKLLVALLLGVGIGGVCAPALAHHGNVAYENKIVEFKQATITKFLWSNPHSLIDFDVKDDKGSVVHWVCETASPEALKLIGWSKSSLAPGDVITIYMYVAKNGNPAGRLNKIVLSDGSTLHDTQLGGDAGNKSDYRPDDYSKEKNVK